MRTTVPVLLLVTIFSLAARPAEAWFGDGWLEKLSGPGPFSGLSVDFRLVCLAASDDTPTASGPGEVGASRPSGDMGTAIEPGQAPGWGATWPKELNRRVWFSPLGCHFLERDKPRLELGFQYDRMSSEGADNPLQYPTSGPAADLDKAVDVRSWMLTADVRVNRVVDLGFAAGRSTFVSPSGLFADLNKTIITPVRVTVRPLSPLSRRNRISEAFAIRMTATKFNGGFRDEEFGALPGTYKEPGELVWGWTALVDIGTLFWVK